MKKLIIIMLISAMSFVFSSCSQKIKKVQSSDSIYVRKVENIPDDFIMGMDASSVISLEEGGVRYYDYDGNESDVFKVLAESGINYIRVRIWNDPYDENGNGYGGGNCDFDKAIQIGKRANAYGMKLLVDFHYSDFWADPGKQMSPKAWKDLPIEEKADALYNFTKDSLKQLKDQKIDVGMVQIGNETNGAMAGEKIWMNIIYHLMSASSKAIREVYPKALIAVHFANPEKGGSYEDYAKKLAYYELDYDVFASSYYPYWHGTLDNLSSILSTIAETYDKKVMVMETSYAYTDQDTDFFSNTISSGSLVTKNYPYSIQGQVNSVIDVIDTIVNKTTSGIGVCYWEGTWISAGGASYEENKELWEEYGSGWASSYASGYDPDDAGKYYGGCAVDNQAFFDENGHPLESLKLFELCRQGNIIELKAESIDDVYVSFDLNQDIVLPDQVEAIMSDNSRKLIDVSWDQFDAEKMKNGGVNTYEVHGTAMGLDAICHISMIEFNYLLNDSFEENENDRIPLHWQVVENGKADELYVENKKTDSLSGNNHYHFWSAQNNSIDFMLEQKVENLAKGQYRFSISIMGGDAGVHEVYAYVKIDDQLIKSAPMKITSYNNWDEGTVEFAYDGTSELITGIYVKCAGEGNGAWGKIDDAKLNAIGG